MSVVKRPGKVQGLQDTSNKCRFCPRYRNPSHSLVMSSGPLASYYSIVDNTSLLQYAYMVVSVAQICKALTFTGGLREIFRVL